jgi:hypothetical protein
MSNTKFRNIRYLKEKTQFRNELSDYFEKSVGSNDVKISQFPKYLMELDFRNFLFKVEVFKKIMNVHGSILEMGVNFGGGLMTWAKLSAIYEPANYSRKIVGFDTFSGFPTISSKDKITKHIQNTRGAKIPKKNDNFVDSYSDLQKSIELYDQDRYNFGSGSKVELVKGDATKTIPKYLKDNPHLTISLLNLDFDIYEPTKVALKSLLPRMPKGSIICFDEVNHPFWPGETLAVLEELGIKNIKLQRFPFAPSPSYAILE